MTESTEKKPASADASPDGDDEAAATARGFDILLDYLKRSRGFDFTGYKRASLTRRIERRMAAVGANDYVGYLDMLEVQPGEFEQLFNTILINVTDFFRDAEPWEFLAREVVPKILERTGATEPIRVWSAGCATGQEPYTLAMLFAEAMGTEQYAERVKVYATDVDEEALTYARHASYTAKEVEGLSPERLERFFEPVDGRYCVRKEYRRTVIFGRNDLIQDAPISRIDLLACRNALMYFDAGTQARILGRFHFALADDGVLLLGRAETMLTRTNLFVPVDLKRRVFAKVPRLAGRLGAPLGRSLALSPDGDGEVVEANEAAFNVSPVAQVVVDRAGRLAMINDRARATFHLLRSDLGRPLQDLELSYRPTELRGPIGQALRDRQSVTLRDVRWRGSSDEPRWYEVQIAPLLAGNGEPAGVSVAFTDTTAYRLTQERLEVAAQELEAAYEELQSTNEELETTNEELHSTVEELETTNEELQSTNEELETMNEELQSTNEELHAANDDMRRQGEERSALEKFQQGIFASLPWAIAVLDADLDVITWNRRAADLWGVRADEVEGTPFADIDSGLPVGELVDAVRECRSAGTERQMTLAATDRRGRPVQCQITVLPLRADRRDVVSGVIVLMDDTGAGAAVAPR